MICRFETRFTGRHAYEKPEYPFGNPNKREKRTVMRTIQRGGRSKSPRSAPNGFQKHDARGQFTHAPCRLELESDQNAISVHHRINRRHRAATRWALTGDPIPSPDILVGLR